MEIFPKILAEWLYNINHDLERTKLISSLQWSVKRWMRWGTAWEKEILACTRGEFLGRLPFLWPFLDSIATCAYLLPGNDVTAYLHHCRQSTLFICNENLVSNIAESQTIELPAFCQDRMWCDRFCIFSLTCETSNSPFMWFSSCLHRLSLLSALSLMVPLSILVSQLYNIWPSLRFRLCSVCLMPFWWVAMYFQPTLLSFDHICSPCPGIFF